MICAAVVPKFLAVFISVVMLNSVFVLSSAPRDEDGIDGFKRREDPRLKVQSFNIRYATANDGANSWPYRKHMVFSMIRGQHIVGLQEALHSQILEIIAELPDYSFIGVGRDDGVHEGEFAAILYNRNQFQVLEQGTYPTMRFWFCDEPEEPGCTSYGNTIPRISTWGHFLDKSTRQSFFHYNLHIDHLSEISRILSIDQLMAHIRSKSAANPNVPFIVTGDFNNNSEKSPEIEYMRKGGFSDSFRILYPDATDVGTYHAWTGDKTAAKIDYVWISDSREYGSPFSVAEAKINHYNEEGRYPSDHFPVEAVLEYPIRGAHGDKRRMH